MNSKGVKMKNLKKKVDNCFSKVLECTYTEWWLINSSCFAFYNISSVYGLIKYFCPGGSRQSGSLSKKNLGNWKVEIVLKDCY